MSVNKVVCISLALRSGFSVVIVTNAAPKLCIVPVFLPGSLSEGQGLVQLRGQGGLTSLLNLGDSVGGKCCVVLCENDALRINLMYTCI